MFVDRNLLPSHERCHNERLSEALMFQTKRQSLEQDVLKFH